MSHPYQPTNYNWLLRCAKDSMISAVDVASIYNITAGSLSDRVTRGTFPKPDGCARKMDGRKKHMWKATTVLTQVLEDAKL